jgi:acyl-CoA synthetase (AMP-forming)/AMP-acid ligase II
MRALLHMGEALSLYARQNPDKPGARDLSRAMTFGQWDERARRLANALLGLGLRKGDRIAILAYNCVEWMEIYAGTANAGLVMVPINFRLLGSDIQFIVDNSEAEAFIVHHDLVDRLDGIRANLAIPEGRYIHFGGDRTPAGYRAYEELIAAGSTSDPPVQVGPEDTWAFMYTSGTTGRPKGAMRSHGGMALHNLATLANFEFNRHDRCLLVMPMCHANSLIFASAFTYAGASSCVYDAKAFDPGQLLRAMADYRATFTSLVPTHYIMMLALSESVRANHDVDCVRRLLISSAPARKDTKLAIMDYFKNSQLFEIYGSTEQGLATILRPDEQLSKLGSIGREFIGCGRIRLLDESGEEVKEGEVGEIYSHTPWCFDGYWKLPEKTAEAFRGSHLSVGDLARRDEDGFYYLVDRKNNMIISGGLNIYPSEVENLLGAHVDVKDVAVIGKPDDKWGESVHGVVVLREGAEVSEQEIIAWCTGRIANYKRPRSIEFIRDEDMPRTATGKILHRVLRDRTPAKG